jgi:hypothetical protein
MPVQRASVGHGAAASVSVEQESRAEQSRGPNGPREVWRERSGILRANTPVVCWTVQIQYTHPIYVYRMMSTPTVHLLYRCTLGKVPIKKKKKKTHRQHNL